MNVKDVDNIKSIANEVIKLSHDELLMNMRFLDTALYKLKVEALGQGEHAYTGEALLYDPARLLRQYKKNINYSKRLYLHSIFHSIFGHPFDINDRDRNLWDLATDIAVENVIVDLGLNILELPTDDLLKNRLSILRKSVKRYSKGSGLLSAQKIYRYFLIEDLSEEGYDEWVKLTKYDEHVYWDISTETEYSSKEWQKIAESIKADLKSFSKNNASSEALEENINIATRDKYDYTDFLRRFMVLSETISVNDDEFDYIYYTYGLKLYENMPLIEPLEYKDSNKIKDFVIAIDTSASCKGELVGLFLEKTVSIMQNSENFFNKINIHILQCDNEVRKDTVIHSKDEFSTFMEEFTVKGFGSTDFRPVFDYVDNLIENNEVDELKGLLYFTDGYGIYPENKKDYDVAFIFVGDDEYAPKVPPWAIKLVLSEENIESFKEKQ